ncbi:phosphoadenylyl-sulfate reductase [Parapedobacter indicus]|uniref:Adenosine 5'-phosphosulfate reductase n=1 Tax=Parapedobacter indicus TaxID=1477437 RepID=A0A1I3QTN6_9SPHI|nr:phosphoadenylyl-sulfate reductase [Parapedobacter indicus]PPL00221.1 phosphoadenylylsulfate reductase (thioredoxin) [Parapedobacter indicus]SFJ36832.1 phosphoadenylylsulfate reductase (thioredoxin) [Parapedobacter indicus]
MNVLTDEINALVHGKSSLDALTALTDRFPGKIVFSTSFGVEDQVITHFIFSNNLPVRVFTLETGRLFPETYYVWNRTLEIYNKDIEAYFPDTHAVQQLISQKGPSSFYESVENRKECCRIRKIEPLQRALEGAECWITGIRAEQSGNRQGMTQVEWDEGNQLIKFHPIYDWSLDDVWKYVKANHIPYNPLHDKGFPSIGCAPCTRAVREGEDFRAGRWWWEDTSKKECGLHAT